LISIEGIEDATSAQGYAGALLTTRRDAIALEPGEYLDDDLIGCELRGVDGRDYGVVDRVEHFPASDMLVVKGKMVPMVRAIVVEIALHRQTILIDPPAGLLD